MAIRPQELQLRPDAQVLEFPVALVRARARRRAHLVMIRRRVVSGTVALLMVAAWLFAGGVGHSAPASVDGAPRMVVVTRGQTLWGLAERFAPNDVDPRAYVSALIELNGLDGAPAIGTRLQLPR